MVIGRAVVRDPYDLAGATRVFTVLVAVQAVGPVAAPVFGAYLASAAGWGSAFVFMTALGAASLLAARLGLPETLPRRDRSGGGFPDSLGSFRAALAVPGFRRPALAGSLGGASVFAFISGSPSLLMGRYGMDAALYGWTFAACSTALAALSQSNHALVRRRSQTAVLRGALLRMVSASLVSSAAFQLFGLPGMLPALAAILLRLAPCPLVFADSAALAMNESGRPAGGASSVLGVMQFSAAGLVSPGLSAVPAPAAFPMGVVIRAASLAGLLGLRGGAGAAGAGAGPVAKADGAGKTDGARGRGRRGRAGGSGEARGARPRSAAAPSPAGGHAGRVRPRTASTRLPLTRGGRGSRPFHASAGHGARASPARPGGAFRGLSRSGLRLRGAATGGPHGRTGRV
jgi:DHA1 family bicyclomycin/chloramphenicol resistance-like MFS transporter